MSGEQSTLSGERLACAAVSLPAVVFFLISVLDGCPHHPSAGPLLVLYSSLLVWASSIGSNVVRAVLTLSTAVLLCWLVVARHGAASAAGEAGDAVETTAPRADNDSACRPSPERLAIDIESGGHAGRTHAAPAETDA